MDKKTNEDVNLFMDLHDGNNKIVANSLNREEINVEEITSASKTIQNINEMDYKENSICCTNEEICPTETEDVFPEVEDSCFNNENLSCKEQPSFISTLSASIDETSAVLMENTKESIKKENYTKYDAFITSVSDIIESPYKPFEFVWESLLPRGSISVLYGDNASLKSTTARCVGFAISFGLKEYLGLKIDLSEEDRKVAIVLTEDNEQNVTPLIKKQNEYFKKFQTIANPVFDIISCCDNGVFPTLEKRLADVHYSYVVIDTPQDDMITSANDNTDVRQYLNQFAKLAEKFNTSILCIYHKRKYTLDKVPSKEDLSGTRALVDKPRSVFELRRHPDNDTQLYLTIVKSNYIDAILLRQSRLLKFDAETMTVDFTGEFVASDEIHLSIQRKTDGEKIKTKVMEYKTANPKVTQGEIAEYLREEFPGRKFSQSTVSTIIKSIQMKQK